MASTSTRVIKVNEAFTVTLMKTSQKAGHTNEGKFLTSIGNTADTEIAAMYSSYAESSFWNKAKAFRRVFGTDFSTVIRNIALQGEYGVLDKDGDMNIDIDLRDLWFDTFALGNQAISAGGTAGRQLGEPSGAAASTRL